MTTTLGDSVSLVALAAYNDQAKAGYVGGRWPTYAQLVKDNPAMASAGDLLSIAISANLVAQCLDVENGDATVTQAPGWYRLAASAGIIKPWFYTSVSNAQTLINTLAAAGIARGDYVLWTAHYSYASHLCSSSCGFGFTNSADATQWTDAANGTDQSLVADGVFPLGRTTVYTPSGPLPRYVGMSRTPSGKGYWQVESTGAVYSYGDATYLGGANEANGKPVTLAQPVVGISAHPRSEGYWLVAADGGLFSYGAATFHGSLGGKRLNAPVVGMSPTQDGQGYWLVAADGGIFAFGDAVFAGSTGAVHLNAAVVGMGSTPDGKGYWLGAADGGIFNFGDATFDGSLGSIHLNRPVVAIAATPSGHGYVMAASDGGVFCFGDAGFHGSLGSVKLDQPIVGMTVTPSGGGYWMSAADGGVFAFGDAIFEGSAA